MALRISAYRFIYIPINAKGSAAVSYYLTIRVTLYNGQYDMDWRDSYLTWLEEALSALPDRGNSRYKQQAYQRCIESLKESNMVIRDPADLHELKYFGEKTVAMLSKKTRQRCVAEQIELPESLKVHDEPPSTTRNTAREETPQAPKRQRKYVPKYNSTAYHVIVGMRIYELQDASGQGLGRTEMARILRPRLSRVVDGSFGKQQPSLTPALSILQKKELVSSFGGRYHLEEAGREIADSLLRVENQQEGRAQSQPSDSLPLHQPELVPRDSFNEEMWQPGSFSVKLLLDTRELPSQANRSGFADALTDRQVPLDVVPLSVGDAVWVAEHRVTHRRAVLDFVVERKNLNDLVASIIDGRFVEQKQRLLRSTLQNVVYLVENQGLTPEHLAQHESRIQTAMSQTLVVNRFHIKITANQNDTVLYLAQMTSEVAAVYEECNEPLRVLVPNTETFTRSMEQARLKNNGLVAIDYDSFHDGMHKSKMKTVGDLFRTMLQTVKGISAEKAALIQRIYPTLTALQDAYEQLPSEEDRCEMLTRATETQIARRAIRPDISELVYNVWGKRHFD